MKQRLLSLLSILITAITVYAYDFSYEYHGHTLYFNKKTQNTCELTRKINYDSGYSGDIEIPDIVSFNNEHYEVTSIGIYAFNECWNLTSVTMPNTITTIESYAFYNCYNLSSIYISNIVTLIGNEAFYNCNNLTSIELPNTLIYIRKGAFSRCSKLKTIFIPYSVTEIGERVFEGCSGLETFTGRYATNDNRGLSVDGTLIAFAPGEITDYATPNGVTSIGNYVFQICHNLNSIKISKDVTSIGYCAFMNCVGLKSVDIAETVTSIGSQAFDNCRQLSDITLYQKDPTKIKLGSYLFDEVPTSTCVLYVPKGSKDLYADAGQWKDFENIKEFDDTTDLESVTTTTSNDDVYYDLTGRRVTNPAPGLYIQNGRKVLVK